MTIGNTILGLFIGGLVGYIAGAFGGLGAAAMASVAVGAVGAFVAVAILPGLGVFGASDLLAHVLAAITGACLLLVMAGRLLRR